MIVRSETAENLPALFETMTGVRKVVRDHGDETDRIIVKVFGHAGVDIRPKVAQLAVEKGELLMLRERETTLEDRFIALIDTIGRGGIEAR